MKAQMILPFLLLSFGLCATPIQSSHTEPDSSATKECKVEERSLLSPFQEELFFKERLQELVVKPVYTTVEQLIYTELLRQATRMLSEK